MSLTPAGIEPATFRFVALHLNHCATAVPRCHLLYLLYFLDTEHVSGINMFIFMSLRLCCRTTTLAVLFMDCCVLVLGCGSAGVVSGLLAEAGSPDTTLAKPYPDSNTQQYMNNTANVVVQQHSRKLLKMNTLMPETC